MYSVAVHFIQCGTSDKEALSFFVYIAFGISAGVYLRGQFVKTAFDFQCAFFVFCRKLFVPLHALTPSQLPDHNLGTMDTVPNRHTSFLQPSRNRYILYVRISPLYLSVSSVSAFQGLRLQASWLLRLFCNLHLAGHLLLSMDSTGTAHGL